MNMACFMKCQEFEQAVRELARHQLFAELMEAGVRAQATAHASECAACAARLAEARGLSAGLHALALGEQSLGAPQRLESALLAAFRQQTHPPIVTSIVTPVAPLFAVRPRQHWSPWALAAAAALLLGLFAYAALRDTRSEAGRQQVAPTLANSPAPPGPMASAPKNLEPAPLPEHQRLRVKTKPAAPRYRIERYLVESEIATDFLPLYDNEAVPKTAGLQTIRVEVPRVLLSRFGLPMSFERAAEPVKADLLIGPDGQTRAIRFVQTDFEPPQIITANK